MEQFENMVRGKRVTLMGLGVLGRGVGDAEFLARMGAHVLVTDLKPAEKLASSIAALENVPGIEYRLGEHRIEDFVTADLVIKAAGVPLNSPYIQAARDAGVPVYMSTALFAKCAREIGARLVGVTGTRGKSTASSLIHHALLKAGIPTYLGGNVRGTSTLALLPKIRSGDVIVLELDSWQLQGFGDLKISPDISVFTNLMPDHQNYYPDMQTYFTDKAQIFLHQRAGDFLCIGREIEHLVRAAHPPVEPMVVGDLPADYELKILGDHNRKNAAFAAAALFALGVDAAHIRSGLESFEAVEGRLQYIGLINGVKVYNDNNATTPEATIAALKALDTGSKNIVLIAGGADKGLPLENFAHEVAAVTKAVVLLDGTGTARFSPMIGNPRVYTSMREAVAAACAAAEFGDILVFSPGFASFGIFANEYERNDQFKEEIAKRLV